MKIIKRISYFVISTFQICSTLLLRWIWLLAIGKIEVHNPPDIERDKPYLFVANHATYLDVYAIFLGMKLTSLFRCAPTRFMTAPSIYYSPLRPIIILGGGFPAKNRHPDSHGAVTESIRYLRDKQNVVIFPEGGRVHRVSGQAHTGVKRIADGYGDGLVIVLVKLSWQRNGHRKHLRVAYGLTEKIISPDETMREIYAL